MSYLNLSIESEGGEIWIPLLGCEHKYHVSNYGRVKAIYRIIPYNKNKSINSFRKERIMKQKVTNKGYLSLTIFFQDGVRTCVPVHRLILSSFKGVDNEKTQGNHIDGNKLNNRIENLEWCNGKENINHAISTGLKSSIVGEKHFKAKLTESDVLTIREKYKTTMMKDLAAEYKVGINCIQKIIYRTTWRHI